MNVFSGAALLLLLTISSISVQRSESSAARLLRQDAKPDLPESPYFEGDKAFCTNGSQYGILGQPTYFPSTPFLLTGKIFTTPFRNPGYIDPLYRSCRDDGHCMSHYNIDVTYIQADFGLPCGKTWLTAYHGSVPGPTFMFGTGEEIHVRFNNKLFGEPKWEYFTLEECDGNHTYHAPKGEYGAHGQEHNGEEEKGPLRQRGIGFSVHNHGQASLAPYDGWAEDWTCPGESKDYLYPGQAAKYGWYHDHGLDITSLNAYHGQAGLFIPTLKKEFGGCGEPWNMDNIPDYHLVLGDVTINDTCQLALDFKNANYGHFFGDVNLVSGIPWPVLTVHPTAVRLRILASGPSRPWHLTFVTYEDGKKTIISDKGRCKVFASEVGFFKKPVDFPDEGMFIGVGERYELLCDFSDLAGKSILLWNEPVLKYIPEHIAVPYFCYSHLVMKINVLPKCPHCPEELRGVPLPEKGTDLVCGDKDKDTACCPDGQFCMPMGDIRVCRLKPLVEPEVPATSTCWLGRDPEPTNSGLRCGGKCFRDADCEGPAKQRACCPAGQFCWIHSKEHWMCRDLPPVAPEGTAIPELPDTCELPKPDWTKPETYLNKADEKLLPAEVFEKAQAMADKGEQHRQFSFGRDDGRRLWVINNLTWHDYKFTTEDIGQSTWEVWRFYTDTSTVFGKNAFHPLHMHLVDFHILRRESYGESEVKDVEPFEKQGAKDMVNLHPDSAVWVLVRFGPHRGEFMFHCHNTRHEDMAMLTALKIKASAADDGDASSNVTTRLGNTKDDQYDGHVDASKFIYEKGMGPDKLSEPEIQVNEAANVVYDKYGDPYSVEANFTQLQAPFEPEYLKSLLDRNVYKIFYPIADVPADSPEAVLNSEANIWKSDKYRKTDKCDA